MNILLFLTEMVEEATDPLELEENQVLIDLQKVIPESAYVYSRCENFYPT